MPRGQVPAQYRDLLESTAYGHLATVDERGRAQVNPVWFLWDGEHVLLSVLAETRKHRNLRRDPHLAMSILDPERPNRYLEIRGEVIAFERYADATFVNQLSRKYTGEDYARVLPGQERYKLTVRINAWTAQDG